MPLNDLNNQHWTEEEKNEILAAVNTVINLARPKSASLDPQERQKFGSINEQNKLFVRKDLEYQSTQPEQASPDVDWAEANNDHDTSTFHQQLRNMLNTAIEGLFAAEIMHDYDLYQAALIDYNYSKYKMESGAIGYETKVNDLKQFFPNTGGSNSNSNDSANNTEGDT